MASVLGSGAYEIRITVIGMSKSAGSMVDGTMFNGPGGLRHALLERSDAFLDLLAEKPDLRRLEVRLPSMLDP